MPWNIYGVADEPDALGLEALAHHEGGLEMHLSRELAETINHTVTWDVEPVAVSHGVECPSHEPRTAARADGSSDMSVRGNLPLRDGTHDVVDALVDVGGHAAR